MKIDITEYESVVLALKAIKEQEATMRREIVAELFPNAGEGTHTILFNGYEVKASIGYNYNLNRGEYIKSIEFFSDEEKACIDLKPNLKLGEYRKLDADDRMFLDDCVEVKPGMPGLKIKLSLEEPLPTFEDLTDGS